LKDLIAEFYVDAMAFTSQSKVEETAHQWLARAYFDSADPSSAGILALALMFAIDIALFTPSLSGSTAIDRLARQRKAADETEKAALTALKQSSFQILRIRSAADPHGLVPFENGATGKRQSAFIGGIPESAIGLDFVARLCPLPSGEFIKVGPLTPLDWEAHEVAMSFVRPGKGLVNPERCAAAVYRHIVRNGPLYIPGLGAEVEEDNSSSPFEFEENELHRLARAWAEMPSGREPAADSVSAARSLTSLKNLLDALVFSVAAHQESKERLGEAYSRLATVQIETMQRRTAAGYGEEISPLDVAASTLGQAVLENKIPRAVLALFDKLRRIVLATSAGGKGNGEDLARVIQRIQGLRAKTTDQGCTEQEALAAAAKVAELLDRYGLSLNEIELKEQACEGFGINTERKRRNAFDSCVNPIAAFCDCRVWSEKTAAGAFRYVFFGLPADIEAARFLYELVEKTFETESTLFKKGKIHADLQPADRRNAVTSFQTGLAHGISGKLNTMKAARDTTNKTSSGRDLAPLKTSIIDDELAKLGLSFHQTSHARKKLILEEAYQAGQIAGRQFEVHASVE
jgi:hypothetical protein